MDWISSCFIGVIGIWNSLNSPFLMRFKIRFLSLFGIFATFWHICYFLAVFSNICALKKWTEFLHFNIEAWNSPFLMHLKVWNCRWKCFRNCPWKYWNVITEAKIMQNTKTLHNDAFFQTFFRNSMEQQKKPVFVSFWWCTFITLKGFCGNLR
mgnify:CR=1 FL=1